MSDKYDAGDIVLQNICAIGCLTDRELRWVLCELTQQSVEEVLELSVNSRLVGCN